MSKNDDNKDENPKSVIPTASKDLDSKSRLEALEKRVALLESRLEAVDHYNMREQNRSHHTRKRGRTGL